MNWPILYHKGKSGIIYSWKIWTFGNTICTEYGQLIGKKQIAKKKAKPKNVGKKNATTAEEQAILEATSMFKFKLERKYRETIEEAESDILLLPMLAHDFEKKKKKVSYPVDIQPKLDGLRCLALWDKGEVVLISRSGKPFYIPHIAEQLHNNKQFKKNKYYVLDGEIYIHGETFQTITKLVKKHREESINLNFWLYDCANPNKDEVWLKRKDNLKKIISKTGEKSNKLFYVTPSQAENISQVRNIQSQYLEHGYEGAIIRTHDHVYSWGYRSPGLLKVKNFQDEEFQVVGYTIGVGKASNTVTWECKTEDGTIFRCYSKGTMEERKEMKENANHYVGQWLKVKFFNRTDDGIPRFPVGVGFRIQEDMENK